MPRKLASLAALPLLVLAGPSAWAQAPAPATPGAERAETAGQVIVPQVERREVRLPKFASRDISLGLFAGTYASQNFGTSTVSGLRLGYHVTEDIFVEATYAGTKVSDEDFRQIFPNGGIFPTPTQRLTYYNVVAGYNVLPGEVFFGRRHAKLSQGYLLAGVGSTDFAGQKRQTITAGFGLRVIFTDWFSVQADVRDHIYSLDLLGKRRNTHNLEVTAGLTVHF